MADPLFSQGTAVKWKTWTGSAFSAGTDLVDLRSLTGNQRTMSFSDTTSLSDTRIRRRPARIDYGTLTLTFTFTDEAVATNQFALLRTALEGKVRQKLEVNLAGTFDDSTNIMAFEGFFSSISAPDVNIDDNVLTYTVTFQVD